MTIPAAWLLSCYGIAFIAGFAAWKLVRARRLAERAIAVAS